MKRTLVVAVLCVAAAAALAASMELTSARLYRKQNEWLKSLQFYDEAIRKEPGLLEAYFERGELLRDIAADESKAALAREIAPDAVDPAAVLYDRMLSDFREAQTPRQPKDEGTVKKLRKKIEQILQDRWTHFYFVAVQQDSAYTAAVAAKVTDPDPRVFAQSALDHLDMAIKMQPEKWNAYGLKAQIYGKLDDRTRAAEYWRLALEKIEASDMRDKERDNYSQAIDVIRGNLLENYYSLERYDDAIQTADEILRKDPQSVDAIQFKAFSLARKANDTTLTAAQRAQMEHEAVTALMSARAARPDDPVILYYIGQFHLQLGDTARAIESFEDYLKLDPGDREVRFALGVIYLEGGTFVNTQKARDEFAALVEADPADGASWLNYGIALIRLGDNVKGKEAIAKGRELRGGE